ncbi:MAG TPA: DUF898 family protein [Azospirillaceae bacterium]|nr:DUF898 family protein [Azospirillaceae bacterium]
MDERTETNHPFLHEDGTAPADVTAFHYDGKLGEIARIWLRNLLLGIVTLGIYRFWGMTRLRRYFWSRLALDGERFEYDGTGMELFKGFLVSLLVLVPLALLPQLLILSGNAWVIGIGVLAVMLGIYWVIFFAYYAGRRYRMSRTRWSGIRMGMDGSAVSFGWLGLRTSLLTVITFSLYLPWQAVRLWEAEADTMRLGSHRFFYHPSTKGLIRRFMAGHLFVAVLAVAGLVGLGAWQVSMLQAMKETGVPPNQILVVAVTYGGIFGFILVQSVLMAPYQAAWLANRVTRTRIEVARPATSPRMLMGGGAQARSVTFAWHGGTWALWRLGIGNLLISVLTLGTGSAFVMHRTLAFLTRGVTVTGAAQLTEVTQLAGVDAPRTEAFADAFDLSGGL